MRRPRCRRGGAVHCSGEAMPVGEGMVLQISPSPGGNPSANLSRPGSLPSANQQCPWSLASRRFPQDARAGLSRFQGRRDSVFIFRVLQLSPDRAGMQACTRGQHCCRGPQSLSIGEPRCAAGRKVMSGQETFEHLLQRSSCFARSPWQQPRTPWGSYPKDTAWVIWVDGSLNASGLR